MLRSSVCQLQPVLQLSSDVPRSRAPAPLQLFPAAGSRASAHAQPGLYCTKEGPGLSLEPLGIAVVPGPAGSIPAFSWGMACGGGKLCWNCCLGVPASTVISHSRVKGSRQRAGCEAPPPSLSSAFPGGWGSRVAGSETCTNAPDLHFLSPFPFLSPSTLSFALPFWHLCTQQRCALWERAT